MTTMPNTKQLNKIFAVLCLTFIGMGVATAQIGLYRAPATAAPGVTSGDWLTAVGDSAGYNMTTGDYNTFIGHAAGFSYDSEGDNTAIGAFANYLGNGAVDNVFIGARAGFHSTGTDCTVIGSEAGYNMTTAADATIVGETAGYMLTTGSDNTFIGEDAGYYTSTASDNTFIGSAAGRMNVLGYRNTAVGNEALYDLGGSFAFAAHHNTAVGDSCLTDNGDGIANTAVGAGAAASNEHASFGTFIGVYAGYDNNRTNSTTNANRNTYVGYKTGYSNREGEDNVGMGALSDYNTTVRSRTTFIGAQIDVDENDVVCVGYSTRANKQFGMALGTNSDVLGNSAIGIGYLSTIGNGGDYSIAIGREASVAAAITNSIAIGYLSTVSAANEVYLGNANITSIGGAVNWTATSDARFKNNVEEDVPGLDFVNRLRPVTYQMDPYAIAKQAGYELPEAYKEAAEAKALTRYTGFLAQEVEATAKEIGYDFSGVDAPQNDKDAYGLRYAEFVPSLVKAVQEQQQIIEEQQKQIEAYRQDLSQLSAQMQLIRAQVTEIQSVSLPLVSSVTQAGSKDSK